MKCSRVRGSAREQENQQRALPAGRVIDGGRAPLLPVPPLASRPHPACQISRRPLTMYSLLKENRNRPPPRPPDCRERLCCLSADIAARACGRVLPQPAVMVSAFGSVAVVRSHRRWSSCCICMGRAYLPPDACLGRAVTESSARTAPRSAVSRLRNALKCPRATRGKQEEAEADRYKRRPATDLQTA